MRLALVGLVLLGCGGALPDVSPSRALCYAGADVRAQKRVDTECVGVAFAVCPAHDAILAELRSDQEACR